MISPEEGGTLFNFVLSKGLLQSHIERERGREGGREGCGRGREPTREKDGLGN